MAVDLVLLPRPVDARQSIGLPPFSMSRVNKPSSLKVVPEEKVQVKMLMERVVQLVWDGVTGMDLLEVFLRRRIQPLQYRGHPMWLYCGTEDTTRVHPEAVDDATLERWVAAITGNKDNPRGARRIPPLDCTYTPDTVWPLISECNLALFILLCCGLVE